MKIIIIIVIIIIISSWNPYCFDDAQQISRYLQTV